MTAPDVSSEAVWCEECHRLVEPEDIAEDGTCGRCGAELVEPPAGAGVRRIPWTFKLLLLASTLYVGWRAYQGVTWLVHHL